MEGRRSRAQGVRRVVKSYSSSAVVQRSKRLAPPASLQSPNFVCHAFSLVLFLFLFLAVSPRHDGLIATGRRDYAQISTNER